MDLAHAALRGPIHFAKTPFYRNLTGHPVGGRVKLGDQQCVTDFDFYRWGLEYLAHDLFVQALNQPDQEAVKKLKVDLNNMIRQFIWTRYEVASRILTAHGRIAEAALLQKRMVMTGY